VFRQVLVFLILSLAVGTAYSEAPDDESLRLILRVRQDAVNLDDCIEFNLSLVGSSVDDLLKSLPTADAGAPTQRIDETLVSPISKVVFTTQSFRFEPTEVGHTKIGPYSLQLGNREIRSNAISVLVAPAPELAETIRLIPDTDSIRVGESFQLTVVGFSESLFGGTSQWDELELAIGEVANVRVVSTSRSFLGESCVSGFSQKVVYVYEVAPFRAGTLTLGKESFRSVQNHVTFQHVSVDVLE